MNDKAKTQKGLAAYDGHTVRVILNGQSQVEGKLSLYEKTEIYVNSQQQTVNFLAVPWVVSSIQHFDTEVPVIRVVEWTRTWNVQLDKIPQEVDLVHTGDRFDRPSANLEALIQRAHDTAKHAHRDMFRNGGQPYIIHPEFVAGHVVDLAKPVAFLHDVSEDNPAEYPITRIYQDFPKWVADRVDVLTRKIYPDGTKEPYDDLIIRASFDWITTQVKLWDLRHNRSDLKKGSMLDKYRLAIHILSRPNLRTYPES